MGERLPACLWGAGSGWRYVRCVHVRGCGGPLLLNLGVKRMKGALVTRLWVRIMRVGGDACMHGFRLLNLDLTASVRAFISAAPAALLGRNFSASFSRVFMSAALTLPLSPCTEPTLTGDRSSLSSRVEPVEYSEQPIE